ncbi:MAG: DNA alkylation repair protein [Bacteroidales bacterium]|nr:DNA alkylation repair protein [Bacteroidales bacterium]
MGTIPNDEVYALQEFENVWFRRLALVGSIALNLKSKGGLGDSKRTITVCTRAVDDHHDMIVKALSWALRSLVRWDQDAVADFLQTHESSLQKRVIREVSHKLEFGTKN